MTHVATPPTEPERLHDAQEELNNAIVWAVWPPRWVGDTSPHRGGRRRTKKQLLPDRRRDRGDRRHFNGYSAWSWLSEGESKSTCVPLACRESTRVAAGGTRDSPMRIGIACTLKPDGPPRLMRPDDAARRVRFSRHGEGHRRCVPLARAHRHANSATAGRSSKPFSRTRPTWSSTSRKAPASAGRARPACPAVCEMLGIPYTGSDPLALAVGARQGHDAARRWSRWA